MSKACFAVIIGVLSGAYIGSMPQPLPKPSRTTDVNSTNRRESDILETVFRYQMVRCYKRDPRKVYFLAYQRSDPPADLMERFEKSNRDVRRFSESRAFYKQRTGDTVVLLGVSHIGSESDSSVIVEGSCGLGGLEGSSYAYRVAKRAGKWKVIGLRRTGFS